MKTKLTVLVFLLISSTILAQQGINYKAILKDTNGNVLANTFMNVQFTIHQTTASGTIVYQEDHNYTTDANGLLILTIGTDSSPSIGVFDDINWSTDLHFLQTTITYSGGTINFDATEFMAVPYAKHAKTAETAANVFSGSYSDLTNRPSILTPGLLRYNEQDGNPFAFGWALTNRHPNSFGPLGDKAVDLTYASTTAISTTRGATGSTSVTMGFLTTASGSISTAMGNRTIAESYNSLAIGRYNVGGGDPLTWSTSDPLFEIGNGSSINSRNNALTVYKNGNAKFDAEIQRTPTGDANLIPIAYGIVESDGNVLSGTGNFTASLNANVITISVNNEAMTFYDTSCLVTPYSTAFRTSSIVMSGGDIQVRTFNSSGSLAPTTFQFAIYKL